MIEPKRSLINLVLKTLTKRLEVFDDEDECVEDGDENDMSSNFLRIQKNQLIDLKQHI